MFEYILLKKSHLKQPTLYSTVLAIFGDKNSNDNEKIWKLEWDIFGNFQTVWW